MPIELAARASQTNIADLAHTEEDERLQRYARAWAAYDGEGPLTFSDEDGQADDNVRFDYASLIVDKGVSFLAGKGGVEFQLVAPDVAPTEDEEADEEDEDDAQAKVDEARARLDARWPEEKRHIDFHKLATNGGVCGHAWLRLYEDRGPEVLDPQNMTAVYNADDVSILERYLQEWTTTDEQTGLGVLRRKRYEPDRPERPSAWTIHHEEYDDEVGIWREIDEETRWAHAFPPVLDAQNLPAPNTYYGQADLEPAVIDLIEQLQSVASEMRRICRLHGHPIPVITGANADQVTEIDVAIGELLAVPGENARFSQLTIAELTSLLAFYRTLKTALFEAVRIPKVALGETENAGPTAGVALQVEYEPLIEKTETKRLLYGALLRRAAECELDLAGLPGWRVTLGWPQMLPTDRLSESQADEADLRMGLVSRQTLAERRSYDWSMEQERIAEERRQAQADFDAGDVDPDDLA